MCGELALWGEEERDAVALQYVADHLDQWPEEIQRWARSDDPAWRRRLANGRSGRDAGRWLEELAEDEASARRIVYLSVDEECIAVLPGVLARLGRLRGCRLYEQTDERRLIAALGAAWPPSMVELRVASRGDAVRGRATQMMRALARNPTLGGLRKLVLAGLELSATSMGALAGSPHLRALRELDLSACDAGAGALRALAGGAILDSVERLEPPRRGAGMELAALVGSPHLGALRSLSVWDAEISVPCARALAAEPWPPALEELELDLTYTSARALAALASAPGLRAMRELKAQNTGEPGRMAGLLASPHLTGLRELALVGAQDDATWRALAQNEALAGLEELLIEDAAPSMAQLDALSRGPASRSVRWLCVEGAGERVAALFGGGRWPALRELRLYGEERGWPEPYRPRLSDADLVGLVERGMLAGLVELRLPYNMLGDAAVEALVGSGQLGGLRRLELGKNLIGDAGLIALIERGGLDSLKVLGIADNQIGDVGAAALANSPLLRLLRPAHKEGHTNGGLLYNKIGRAGVLALLRSTHLDGLEGLDLYENALTHEDIVALAAAPELARLRGSLWVSAPDAREETWRALIDSPYASEPTREQARLQLELLHNRRRTR